MLPQILESLIILSISFLASYVFIFPLRKIALRYNIQDHPEERKIHIEPVPYLGGVSIFIGFLAGLLIAYRGYQWIDSKLFCLLVISSSMIFLLGIYDDIKGANAKIKFSTQIIVASFVVLNDIYVPGITNPFGGSTLDLHFFGPIFTVLWIVFITNSFNLLDGLDGLASGISLITLSFMLGFAFVSMDSLLIGLLTALGGSVLAFLIFNFPPAKIYMGDAGSLLIGFLISIFCILPASKGPYGFAVLIPAILMIIPIIDTILAILRRVYSRTKIFSADKKHLHHRILVISKSYRKTLFIIYGVNIYICMHSVLAWFLPNEFRIILFFILAQDILVGIYFLRIVEKMRRQPASTNERNAE